MTQVVSCTHLSPQDEPKWTPYNRGEATDINPFRVEYLKGIAVN